MICYAIRACEVSRALQALLFAALLGMILVAAQPARADHCSTGQDDCVALATCFDTGGFPFFDCLCPAGFVGNGHASGSACSDINECASDPCDENAACTNTAGSFSCSCNEGYEGSGLECTPIVVNSGPRTKTPMACQATSYANGFPTAVTPYHDGGFVAMNGIASPDPADAGAAVMLEDASFEVSLPSSLALVAYSAGGVFPAGPGENTWTMWFDSSIDAPATAEGSIGVSTTSLVHFTIEDSNSTYDGDETATIDPFYVVVPDSIWTALQEDIHFSPGEFTVYADFPPYGIGVECLPGSADPVGTTFTPAPPNAFALVHVPTPTTTSFECYEATEFGLTYPMPMTLGGVLLPEPVTAGFPAGLQLTTLSSAINGTLLSDMLQSGFLVDDTSELVTITVQQTIEATSAAPAAQSLGGQATSLVTVASQSISGGDWSVSLADSSWTPIGLVPIELTQGPLDVQITTSTGSIDLTCTPSGPPPVPFEIVEVSVLVPVGSAWGGAVLAASLVSMVGRRLRSGRGAVSR